MKELYERVAEDFEGHFVLGDHYGPEGVRIDVATYREDLLRAP